jgi:hypothetical protein
MPSVEYYSIFALKLFWRATVFTFSQSVWNTLVDADSPIAYSPLHLAVRGTMDVPSCRFRIRHGSCLLWG